MGNRFSLSSIISTEEFVRYANKYFSFNFFNSSTVSRLYFLKLIIFLDNLEGIKNYQTDTIIIEKNINKEIVAQENINFTYTQNLNFDFITQNIEKLFLNCEGRLYEDRDYEDKNLNFTLKDEKSFMYAEQIYDDIIEMCEMMLKKLDEINKDYRIRLNNLKEKMNKYLIIEAL